MRWLLVANMSSAILSVSSRSLCKEGMGIEKKRDKSDGTKKVSGVILDKKVLMVMRAKEQNPKARLASLGAE